MFVRNLDQENRLVIPSEIAKRFDINHGTHLLMYSEDSKIVIEKFYQGCIFCEVIKCNNYTKGNLIARYALSA